MNHFATPIFNYCKALYEHDWTFEYSDDQRVWQRGRAQRQELQLLQPHIDPDFAIWNKFAPSDFQRKSQAPAVVDGAEAWGYINERGEPVKFADAQQHKRDESYLRMAGLPVLYAVASKPPVQGSGQ